MNPKRIVVLSDVSYPDTNAGASRIYERLKYWSKTCDVTLVTQKPKNQEKDLRTSSYNFSVKRLARAPLSPGAGLLRKGIEYTWFSFASFFYLLFYVKKNDFLFSSSPQFLNLIVAFIISKLKGAKLVLEISDLWPDILVDLGLLKRGGIPFKVWERVEIFIYKRADLVIGLTSGIAKKIELKTKKSIVAHPVINGFDASSWRPKRKYQEGDTFIVGYYGTLGRVVDIASFLEVSKKFHTLHPNLNVEFHLAGKGVKEKLIHNFISDNHKTPLKYFGELKKEEMQGKWDETTICFIPLSNIPSMEVCIPAKLLECVGVGVPVLLSSPESDATRLINEFNLGTTTRSECVDLCVKQIHSWRTLPSKILKVENSMDLHRSKFTREIQANKIYALINSIDTN